MDTIDYSNLKESGNQQYLNYVGDFFDLPIVRRALGTMWNFQYRNNQLDFFTDFSITHPEHLSFLRSIIEGEDDEEKIKTFLFHLRNAVFDGSKVYDIQQYYWEITAFIMSLDWLHETIDPNQGISVLFKKEVLAILDEQKPQYEDVIEGFEANAHLQGFDSFARLPRAGFLPFDEEGRVLNAPHDIVPIASAARAFVHKTETPDSQEPPINKTEVIINKQGEILDDVDGYEALRDSARVVCDYITDALKIIESGDFDIDYLEKLVIDLDISEEILKIGERREQIAITIFALDKVRNIHLTMVDIESQNIRNAMLRSQKATTQTLVKTYIAETTPPVSLAKESGGGDED